MTSTLLDLKTAIGDYGHHAALKDDSLSSTGFRLTHVRVEPIISAFRRMCREQEFDVCEMAITTYLTARAYGLPFTAIPVFPVRILAHNAIMGRRPAPEPKELEGNTVGVRAYTVTTGVWVRGILASEYNVDLSKVTWLLVDEEHVQAFHKDAPPNTVYEVGKSLAELLTEGRIAAAIGAGTAETAEMEFVMQDPIAAARDYYQRTGIYPINHTIVVRNSLLSEHPGLATGLFEAFSAAKHRWEEGASDEERSALTFGIVPGDPIPYGLEPNRRALETVIGYAHEQGIIPRFRVEDVFAADTLKLAD